MRWPQVGDFGWPSGPEAAIAGDLLASLQKMGRIIGMEDLLIASTALTHKCVLVTANVRHFMGVDTLNVENWLKPL